MEPRAYFLYYVYPQLDALAIDVGRLQVQTPRCVLWCSMEELEHWGDALDEQREAWIGTPVEALFE